MVLNLKTPVSDPFTNGKLVATIDLESLKDVIPLEGTELKGLIKANLDWMGKYSSIEKERYEEFKADGTIEVNDLYYNSPDIPKSLTLRNSLITFSPKSLEIANFDAVLGASDFRLYGKVSNYIAYILKDETVKGELSLKSNLLDIDEFMSSEEVENETSTIEDTSSIEVFPIPENIDFRFTSSIGKVLYDKLDIRNFEGVIQMKDKKLIMENLSMNALDGSLLLSGEYNTVDIKNPYIDLNIAAKGIDIPMCFVAFDVLGKIAPVAAKATGKVNLGMTYSSFLDKRMSPVVKTIAGSGNLSSEQIGIKGSNAFSAIGAALKTDALNNLTLKDVNFDFVIQEGTLTIKPFETQMGDVALKIEGQQSFEKTLNYTINLNAPRQLLGLENPAINNLYNQAASGGLDFVKSETVALLVRLTGDIKNPQVKLDLKENAVNVVENVKEEIKDAAKEVIETQTTKIKDEAKEKSRAEADKIIKEAEKQAASVRTESKKAADAVRAEANANANKLMNEAKNPISKRAAEPAAKKLRDEGEAKAKRIELEADQKATRIVNDAKAKSDKLLQ
jgi:cell division septum initiation protein DivIVA